MGNVHQTLINLSYNGLQTYYNPSARSDRVALNGMDAVTDEEHLLIANNVIRSISSIIPEEFHHWYYWDAFDVLPLYARFHYLSKQSDKVLTDKDILDIFYSDAAPPVSTGYMVNYETFSKILHPDCAGNRNARLHVLGDAHVVLPPALLQRLTDPTHGLGSAAPSSPSPAGFPSSPDLVIPPTAALWHALCNAAIRQSSSASPPPSAPAPASMQLDFTTILALIVLLSRSPARDKTLVLFMVFDLIPARQAKDLPSHVYGQARAPVRESPALQASRRNVKLHASLQQHSADARMKHAFSSNFPSKPCSASPASAPASLPLLPLPGASGLDVQRLLQRCGHAMRLLLSRLTEAAAASSSSSSSSSGGGGSSDDDPLEDSRNLSFLHLSVGLKSVEAFAAATGLRRVTQTSPSAQHSDVAAVLRQIQANATVQHVLRLFTPRYARRYADIAHAPRPAATLPSTSTATSTSTPSSSAPASTSISGSTTTTSISSRPGPGKPAPSAALLSSALPASILHPFPAAPSAPHGLGYLQHIVACALALAHGYAGSLELLRRPLEAGRARDGAGGDAGAGGGGAGDGDGDADSGLSRETARQMRRVRDLFLFESEDAPAVGPRRREGRESKRALAAGGGGGGASDYLLNSSLQRFRYKKFIAKEVRSLSMLFDLLDAGSGYVPVAVLRSPPSSLLASSLLLADVAAVFNHPSLPKRLVSLPAPRSVSGGPPPLPILGLQLDSSGMPVNVPAVQLPFSRFLDVLYYACAPDHLLHIQMIAPPSLTRDLVSKLQRVVDRADVELRGYVSARRVLEAVMKQDDGSLKMLVRGLDARAIVAYMQTNASNNSSSSSPSPASPSSAAPAAKPRDEDGAGADLVSCVDVVSAVMLRRGLTPASSVWERVLGWVSPPRVLSAEQRDDINALFEFYDTQRMGKVALNEVVKGFIHNAAEGNIDISIEDVSRLTMYVDVDIQGYIDKIEFILLFRNIWNYNLNFDTTCLKHHFEDIDQMVSGCDGTKKPISKQRTVEGDVESTVSGNNPGKTSSIPGNLRMTSEAPLLSGVGAGASVVGAEDGIVTLDDALARDRDNQPAEEPTAEAEDTLDGLDDADEVGEDEEDDAGGVGGRGRRRTKPSTVTSEHAQLSACFTQFAEDFLTARGACVENNLDTVRKTREIVRKNHEADALRDHVRRARAHQGPPQPTFNQQFSFNASASLSMGDSVDAVPAPVPAPAASLLPAVCQYLRNLEPHRRDHRPVAPPTEMTYTEKCDDSARNKQNPVLCLPLPPKPGRRAANAYPPSRTYIGMQRRSPSKRSLPDVPGAIVMKKTVKAPVKTSGGTERSAQEPRGSETAPILTSSDLQAMQFSMSQHI